MHKQNVVGIVFRGAEGKKAIMQIMNAKPVKPAPDLEKRMQAFEKAVEEGRAFSFGK